MFVKKQKNRQNVAMLHGSVSITEFESVFRWVTWQQ